MAYVYGDFQLRNGGTVYARADAYIASQDEHGATIAVTAGAHLVSGAWVQSTGVVAKLIVDGTQIDALTVFGNGTYYAGPDWKDVTASTVVFKVPYTTSVSVGVAMYEYEDGREIAWGLHLTPAFPQLVPAAPNAPTGLTATRNSDASAALAWALGSAWDKTYGRIYVERSTDGGDFAVLGYVSGGSTSYTDGTIAANHSYTYRIRAWNDGNGGQYSAYATASAIYTTPAAPTTVAGARDSGTAVALTVTNPANTATGFDVEQSTDGETWEAATVASSGGDPVASITVTTSGGSFYFRVRNTRGELASAWTVSNLVVTITPPAAPTLTAPTSGLVIEGDGSASVAFAWQHNPYDGSAQTAAEVRYRASTSSTWTTLTATTAQTLTASIAEGATYVWQARTKGAADDYGPWSATSTFSVYEAPTITLDAPAGTITGMPIDYTVGYDDPRGIFAAGTIAIKLDGAVLYSEALPATATTMGTSSPISGQITTDEFIPTSGNTYTFEVSVRSSDTLTASLTTTREVSMGEPNHGTLTIQNDPETGYANLVVGWDTSTGDAAAVSATVYRVTDAGRVLLGEGLAQGAAIIDRYAPLNTAYIYEVVTVSSALAVFTVPVSNTITTGRWFAYWGDSGIAWGIWNPTSSWSITRPEKTRVHYAGRAYPVSYDGTAIDEEHSVGWLSVDVLDSGRASGFRELMAAGGRGVYKSADGLVFRADFEYTETPDWTSATPMSSVGLTVYRIDGEAL